MQYTILYSEKGFAPMMGIKDENKNKMVEELIAKVNRHIADGWTPLGGIASYHADRAFGVFQAMTKG